MFCDLSPNQMSSFGFFLKKIAGLVSSSFSFFILPFSKYFSPCVFYASIYPVFVAAVRTIAYSGLLPSSWQFVCPFAWNNLAPIRRIFMKFNIWIFFENISRNFKFHSNLKILTGTIQKTDMYFLIISG